MCAATVRFISNNDNHSAEEHTKKSAHFASNAHQTPKKEKKKQKLFANVRIFCPIKKKTYKIDSKRKIKILNK